MTLQERITKLQEELQGINQQLLSLSQQHAQWNDARLKTEGALIVLQRMADEEAKELASTEPTLKATKKNAAKR